MNTNKCPVCGTTEAKSSYRSDGADVVSIVCPLCGNFQLSRTLSTVLQRKNDVEVAQKYAPRWVISAAIRNRYEQGDGKELVIKTVENLLEVARIPEDPFESINLLLLHIKEKAQTPGQAIPFVAKYDYPLVYAQKPEEFSYYIEKAIDLELIESGSGQKGYRLGLEGWRRLKKLENNRKRSTQAFIAMWFNDDMKTAYTEGIKPALKESGYKPFRIDKQEHNEKIDDKIIAEIRESGLLIADFTGQRGGVYFEAGFAKGLGIEVIWTCREDEVNKLHFDTRQYNHIVWKTPEDLKTLLKNRIAATLPRSESSTI
ncbi:MAG TPA: hypothetical protein VE912_23445 [Bacteroidales bacterium]|nr:hypothetical protein [Bacteroidales bacterium]